MPDQLRDSQRTSGVARGRLDPDLLEWPFTQDASVADAIERHTTREAEAIESGLLVRRPHHPQHDFFTHFLNRPGEIHLALGELGFRLTRRPVKEGFELPVGHGQTGEGTGITKKIGAMAVVANLHDKRIVQLTDGELFHTISFGKGVMQGYAPQLSTQDRWAVVAYLRALQLSRLGTVDDLAPETRAKLP